MLDVIKGIVTTLGAADPRSHIIQTIGDAIGVPPAVTQAVKTVVGAATGNFVMAAEGGIKFLDAIQGKEIETEYAPRRDGSGRKASDGYAPVGTASHASSGSRSGQTVAFKLDSQEALAFVSTEPQHERLRQLRNRAVECGPGSGAMREYMDYLKHKLYSDPSLRAQFEKHFGVEIVGHYGASNEIVVRKKGQAPSCDQPGANTGRTRPEGSGSHRPPASPGATSGAGGNSPLDPNILEYQQALEVLLANYETYDTARGINDDLLTRENLRAITGNPNASGKLKDAAQFLLDHPEYYDRLEMAAKIGTRDGVVGKRDVEADLAQVKKDIAKYGVDSNSPSSGTGGNNGLSQILSDPTMSIEEKIDAILNMVLDRTDEEILEVMREMEANSAKGKPGNNQAQSHEQQSSQEKLNLKLQKLMEKRKQMFDLLSNFSQKFNEMAKTAIQNMARA